MGAFPSFRDFPGKVERFLEFGMGKKNPSDGERTEKSRNWGFSILLWGFLVGERRQRRDCE